MVVARPYEEAVVEGGLSARDNGALVRDLVARVAPVDASRYLNRELSWLDFNEGVLAMAGRDTLPLLERVNFPAIFSKTFEEFFQVRMGTFRGGALAEGIAGEKLRFDE